MGWLDKARKERDKLQEQQSHVDAENRQYEDAFFARVRRDSPVIEMRLREIGEFYYEKTPSARVEIAHEAGHFGDYVSFWGCYNAAAFPGDFKADSSWRNNCPFYVVLQQWKERNKVHCEYRVGDNQYARTGFDKFSDKWLQQMLSIYAVKGMPSYYRD
jgi:hypothetical protein